MKRVQHIRTSDGKHYGYRFACPGCQDDHVIPTLPHERGWAFNADEEKPTFDPSILVYESKKWDLDATPPQAVDTPRCHSFVRDGKIQYLSDSTHALAGKTVDLPELPE